MYANGGLSSITTSSSSAYITQLFPFCIQRHLHIQSNYECISLASAKFSDVAYRWDIQKKETYAIVASIKHMQYILTGKYFIIEIDNKNATYLNTETSCIVTRWRHYMQKFYNYLRFIPGKFNTSDWLTRQHNLYNLYCEYNDNSNYTNPNEETRKIDQNEYAIQVLSLLVNIDGQTDEILQYFPGGGRKYYPWGGGQ
jgi:hypothetical protein